MKKNRSIWYATCACASLGIGGIFVANAGQLNPPTGAVAPTMNTLSELFAVSGQQAGGISTTALGPPRELTAMSIFGGVQGPIDGEDVIGGVPGVIGVYGFSHDITVPIDQASGQATGVRIHSPIRVVKAVDSSTPKLYSALSRSENLNDVTLRFYRIEPSLGTTQQYYTVQLTQARVVSVRPFTVPSTDESYRHMEEVSFTYSQITWTWEIDGTNETDSWAALPGP